MLVSKGGSLNISLKYLGLLLIFCERIFPFYDDCLEAFETLKKALISAPIVQPPHWNLPFKIMCDASDYVVGDVLGKRVDKKHNVIHYASNTLDSDQRNYATTETEFLTVVLVINLHLMLLIPR